MNRYGSAHRPFLFVIDFEAKNPEILPLDEVKESDIRYNYEGISNTVEDEYYDGLIEFKKQPPLYGDYLKAFNEVMDNLRYGNSYLVNLTFPTKIETNLSLSEIYRYCRARFKLWFRDRFVVFSPEPFVKIENGRILSFPMKGTIDGALPNAEKILLNNYKETAEHSTIVDLIRNDLSMIAAEVRVEEFRYIEKVVTNCGELLQVSSRISGRLPADYHEYLGDLIFKILPAGSVTGAPKEKTVEIIKSAEKYERGFYTGVMGIFDGTNLTSSVMIRFIEKTGNALVYKSGGGITIHSNPEEEYEELVRKVYVPFI